MRSTGEPIRRGKGIFAVPQCCWLIRVAYKHARQDQPQRAITVLDKVLAIAPTYARGYFARALIESELDPVASFADLQAAAALLSRDGRLPEYFLVLDHLIRAPRNAFVRGASSTAYTAKFVLLDSSGRPYLDVDKQRSEAQPNLVEDLITCRLFASVRRGREMRTAAGLAPLLTPVNPLLLCTAIATALVTQRDNSSLLVSYLQGIQLPPMYTDLLGRPRYGADDLLAQHLTVEEELLEVLCVLSLRWIAAERFDVAVRPDIVDYGQWRDEWTRMTIAADGGDRSAEVDREIVRWGTWLLANPLLLWIDEKSAELLLWKEGFASNSQIHVARREAKRMTIEQNEQFNQLLRHDTDAATKKFLLEDAERARALGKRVLRRAERFYVWNPAEIDAREFAAGVTAAVYEGEGEKSDELDELEELELGELDEFE